MKFQNKILFFVLILVGFVAPVFQAYGQTPGAGRFGLGLVLGSPTAITGKYWNSNNTAIDFGLSYSTNSYFLIYGDYIWHYPGGFGHKSPFVSQLIPYIGVGGGLYNWASGYYYQNRPFGWRYYDSSIGLYARVPLGIEWFPRQPSIGVFVEVAPGLALIPGLGITIDAGIGIRYYF